MKLSKILILLFLIVLCFNQTINCQDDDDDNDSTSEEDQSNKDSFDALGIPAFKLDIGEHQKPKQKLKLSSIEDLPRFIESGQYSNSAGIKLITKFLSEDDEELKQIGGLYDETGTDGLETEDDEAEGTEQRNQQRARSAALLYLKSTGGSMDYQPYGETSDKEVVPNWLTYQVLMMNTKGGHQLVKVCIPDMKNIDNVIVFGMGDKETCAEKVQLAYDLTEKGVKYYKKAGFEKFLPKNTPEGSGLLLGDPALQEMRLKEKSEESEKKEEKNDDDKKEDQDEDKDKEYGKEEDKDDDKEKQENNVESNTDDSSLSDEDREMQELQRKMKEVADKKKKKEKEAKEAKKKAEELELKKLENKNKEENDKKNKKSSKKEKKDNKEDKTDQKDSENAQLKDEVQLLKDQLAELKNAIKPQSQSQSDTKNLRAMYAKKDRAESSGIYNQIQKKIRGSEYY